MLSDDQNLTEALLAALVEVERFVGRAGWDQPARLFGLAPTAELLAAEPSLADQRTDVVRILDAIDDLELTADLHAIRRAASVLRGADYKVTAVVIDETLVDVEPGDTTARRFAIAYDLGTTTVVATLLDLSTGTPAAVASMQATRSSQCSRWVSGGRKT